MLFTSSPTTTTMTTLIDIVEGRRRLIEATREASRWRTPKRRPKPATPKAVVL